MAISLEKVEKELGIPKDQIIKEGLHRSLEMELKNLSAEILMT